MYNRYLKLFIDVADYGSFSKAAADLFISPNAVLKQINNFEEHLGFPLFKRSNHGLTLTDEGRIIYTEGKKIIRRSDRIIRDIRQKRSMSENTIRIGNSFLFPSKSIMKLWTEVQDKCPDLTLRNVPFSETGTRYFESSDPIWESVDMLLVNLNRFGPENGLRKVILQNRPLCIAMSLRHPLAEKEMLEIADLNGETVMIVDRGLSDYVDKVRDELSANYPDVHIMDTPVYDVDTFNRCADQNMLMLSVADWEDIQPSIINVPVNWSYAIPYGILYREKASPAVELFIKEIETAIKETNKAKWAGSL